MNETLFGYYGEQDMLPTYGNFLTWSELNAHERHRRRVFTDKLYLPPQLFRGMRLLEFGPDAGENSLVFALWGANCTLAEPNLKAHAVIQSYFQRFDQVAKLVELRSEDVLNYPQPRSEAEQFDVVDAEGFIYTIQPSSLWIKKLSELVRPDGFVVLFYCEAYGCFLELMLKVAQARLRSLTGLESMECAKALFQAKWDSIPHKRRIESWVMDVLENPFVRLKYFLEPKTLCGEMAKAGFQLYSSWPRYDDSLELYWFKRDIPLAECVQKQSAFVGRSRLSHLLGRKHFLIATDVDLDSDLWKLLQAADSLIDQFSEDLARQCDESMSELERLLKSEAIFSEPEDINSSLQTISSLRRLLHLLVAGSAEDIIDFCKQDTGYVYSWGMPAHFSVFRRLAP